MVKNKYLLYAFKHKVNTQYQYWYETDDKYFRANKPSVSVLQANSNERDSLGLQEVIENPWYLWDSNDVQKITSVDGVCINYLRSTDNDKIQKQEDLKLLELYSHLVEHFDISRSFGFNTVEKWHEQVFSSIYPFAGKLRTVEMSKGMGDEAWVWRVDFINGVPELNEAIKVISKKSYDDIETITEDLAKLISDFLFIHPFREGNGRISRLLCDIILAKNGLPMIGLKLKKEDNYIQKVHAGYNCDYEPMKTLLKAKIEEELMRE